jgi:hypothetical protein
MDAFEQWAKDQQSVLVSLATRGATAFDEHRGYTSKAGYYKKYFATGSPRTDASVHIGGSSSAINEVKRVDNV